MRFGPPSCFFRSQWAGKGGKSRILDGGRRDAPIGTSGLGNPCIAA